MSSAKQSMANLNASLHELLYQLTKPTIIVFLRLQPEHVRPWLRWRMERDELLAHYD